jgi:two-component system phosphate regulon response regulator OmpR
MQTMSFDLLILDVMMPGEDGIPLLKSPQRSIRRSSCSLPAANQRSIEGLKLGRHYLPSFGLKNSAGTRHPCGNARETRRRDQLSGMVYHAANELRRDGRLVRLTESETQLLSILANRAGAAITRHELAALTAAGVERSVDVQVTRLRRKIERDPREPVHLQTVRGVGYRLTGD